MADWFIAANAHRFLGASVGNGHCVALVREACKAPHTSHWRAGMNVQANVDTLPSGLAIATFDPDGRYGNHTDGRSHTAIFISARDNGLYVIDQWVGHRAAYRTIRTKGGDGPAADDASRYAVVETHAEAVA
jgi:hypothetical protein